MKTNTFEIRSGGDLRAISRNKLSGYAAIYNSLSQDLGGFVERILPGAFTKSLSAPDNIRALYEHDNQRLLGRVGSGSLKLHDDGKGLHFELTLPDTSYARDLGVLVERGDLAGMSFGFVVPSGGDHWELRAGSLVRDLHEVQLHEITVTANPAYQQTEVALRSMADWQRNENIMTRGLGMSNESHWLRTI